MFQFTTTNVVNSAYWNGYTPVNDKEKDEKHALFAGAEGHLYVKGVNDFLKENVTAVYRAKAREPKFESLTFNFNHTSEEGGVVEHNGSYDVKKGDVFRINMYIGLSQGSNDAMYSNDYYFKGKPFVVEFTYTGKWNTTLEKLDKTIKKLNLTSEGEKIVDVDINPDDKTITITAINEYQRFKKYSVEQLDNRAYQGMGDWIEIAEPEEYITSFTHGSEGFGTYAWILHNLRIPTAARNDMFGQNFEETPEVGATYDQYTIHYCKNRGSLGLNAVGDQTMSHTTHVFYVKSSGCGEDISSQFASALSTAFGTGNAESDFVAEELTEPHSFGEDYKSDIEVLKISSETESKEVD